MNGIKQAFGDNSESWNRNFGITAAKLHLAFRCLILFASMVFFGAMVILESGDKYAAKKTFCESDVSALPEVYAMR